MGKAGGLCPRGLPSYCESFPLSTSSCPCCPTSNTPYHSPFNTSNSHRPLIGLTTRFSPRSLQSEAGMVVMETTPRPPPPTPTTFWGFKTLEAKHQESPKHSPSWKQWLPGSVPDTLTAPEIDPLSSCAISRNLVKLIIFQVTDNASLETETGRNTG